jgi:hypothetical protein
MTRFGVSHSVENQILWEFTRDCQANNQTWNEKNYGESASQKKGSPHFLFTFTDGLYCIRISFIKQWTPFNHCFPTSSPVLPLLPPPTSLLTRSVRVLFYFLPQLSKFIAMLLGTTLILIYDLFLEPALDPKVYKKFKLIEKIVISHNTAL